MPVSAWEVEIDEFGMTQVVNETDIPLTAEDIVPAMQDAMRRNPLIAEMVRWQRSVHGPTTSRRGGMVERDRYVTPHTTFDQIRTARAALDDDIVEGVAELTEGLAFKRVEFYAQDEDEENIWNQWAETVNLDGLLRQAWNAYFTDSTVVFALWWGREQYTVDGYTSKGNARRKKFDLRVPTAIDTIDALKVAPVGELLFGRERLAYIATQTEAQAFDDVLAGRTTDTGPGGLLPAGPSYRWDDSDVEFTNDIVLRLIERRYEPNWDERRLLLEDGVDPNNLFLLRDGTVFRHNATRPGGFKRYPRVRMKSVFELLDLKTQLRQKDRVFIMAGINFILVIKRGDKDTPADDVELQATRAGVANLAQVPIIVGPHTLSVEIVTPSQEHTINTPAWDALDQRIAARLLRQFGPRAAQRTHEGDLAQMVGHWLESERQMLRRTFEQYILGPIRAGSGDQLTAVPKLRFHPEKVALAFDPAYATFLLDLRANRELSRGTLLSTFGMSQEDEAAMLEREKDEFDDIFGTLATPGAAPAVPIPNEPGTPSAPTSEPSGGGVKVTVTTPGGGGAPAAKPAPAGPAAQRRAGRAKGGTRSGGGAAPGTGQGKAPRSGVPSKADLEGLTRSQLIVRARRLEIAGRTRMANTELIDAIVEAAQAAGGEEDS